MLRFFNNESNKRKTSTDNKVDPLGELPHINYYDMERYANLLGE